MSESVLGFKYLKDDRSQSGKGGRQTRMGVFFGRVTVSEGGAKAMEEKSILATRRLFRLGQKWDVNVDNLKGGENLLRKRHKKTMALKKKKKITLQRELMVSDLSSDKKKLQLD